MAKYNTVQNTIENDRDSGYKNSQYAVAELIDNSIQAGFKTESKKSEVDLIVVEEKVALNSRNIDRVTKVIVADNAIGMNAEIIAKALAKGEGENKNAKGDNEGEMGKFGYGLYMSSISQCTRTDIYSWQNKKILHSWLDIEEILNNNIEDVPVEEMKEIPSEYYQLLSNPKSNNGTLVVWSNLDRSNWKTAAGIYRNVEFEIGRMYRHFINQGQVKIKYRQYKKTGQKNYSLKEEKNIRPNDPLYLMKNTNCPEPWHKKPGFVESPKIVMPVNYKGIKGDVVIRFAIATEEFRGIKEPHGGKPWGQHARKNNGVSVVREGRELEINETWNNPSEPRERWVNAEISFGRELDALFRVTTNKQHAMNIFKRSVSELASYNSKTVPGYMAFLKDEDQEEYILTEISQKIEQKKNNLLKTIKEYRKDIKNLPTIKGSPEAIATTNRKNRTEKTKADKQFEAADKKNKLKAMIERLVKGGMDKDQAEKLAKISVDREISTIITAEEISGPFFFDIKIIEGQYHIIINKSHPAYLDFFNLLERESENKSFNEPSSDRAIKLMLSAWASLEDESVSTQTQYSSHLQDIRLRWGQIFRDLLDIKVD